MKSNFRRFAGPIVTGLFLLASLSAAFAATEKLSDMTVHEFVARCDRDKATWCYEKIMSVALADSFNHSFKGQKQTICVPDVGNRPMPEYERAIRTPIVGWLKRHDGTGFPHALEGITAAMQARWPCKI